MLSTNVSTLPSVTMMSWCFGYYVPSSDAPEAFPQRMYDIQVRRRLTTNFVIDFFSRHSYSAPHPATSGQLLVCVITVYRTTNERSRTGIVVVPTLGFLRSACLTVSVRY